MTEKPLRVAGVEQQLPANLGATHPTLHYLIHFEGESVPVGLAPGRDTLEGAARKILAQAEGILPKIDRVIFNGPATIVFWDDGVKTVVKCRVCDECTKVRRGPIPVTEDGPSCGPIQDAFFCAAHYDREKGVMAAMLERLNPRWCDEMRGLFLCEG